MSGGQVRCLDCEDILALDCEDILAADDAPDALPLGAGRVTVWAVLEDLAVAVDHHQRTDHNRFRVVGGSDRVWSVTS